MVEVDAGRRIGVKHTSSYACARTVTVDHALHRTVLTMAIGNAMLVFALAGGWTSARLPAEQRERRWAGPPDRPVHLHLIQSL